MFVCPSDPKPFPTDSPCRAGVKPGDLVNGVMVCDWSAQKNSYIPVYNAMPAHDWTVVNTTQFSSPSNQIVVTEHRNDNIANDGHKGVSGVMPSQPCYSVLAVFPPSKGQYSYFSTQFALQKYDDSKKGNTQALFKTYDILRVAWDRHTNGQGSNYSYADGHSKYQNLGQTLNPQAYQYGETWLPLPAIWNNSCK
jgi:prepilin-type processing-associated H-X9-DG protein